MRLARASELVSERSIRLLTQILLSEFYRRRGLPLSTLQQDSEIQRDEAALDQRCSDPLVRMGLTH
jgi:hypothetical protein